MITTATVLLLSSYVLHGGEGQVRMDAGSILRPFRDTSVPRIDYSRGIDGWIPESICKPEGLRSALEVYTQSQVYPGGVVAFSQKGESESFGYFAPTVLDIEGNLRQAQPIECPDTVFWGGLLSHPLLAVTALTFVEDGAMRLDDPISDYLPEFMPTLPSRNVQGGGNQQHPIHSPITIHDLISNRSGLAWPKDSGFGDLPVADTNSLRELAALVAGAPPQETSSAKLPDGPSYEVLGALMEAISGTPITKIVQDRLTGPLGLTNTGWDLPKEKRGLLGTYYRRESFGTAKMFLIRPPWEEARGQVRNGMPSLSAGFFSTPREYLAFCVMLANSGRLHDIEILRDQESLRVLHSLWRVETKASTGSVQLQLPSSYGIGEGKENSSFVSVLDTQESGHLFVVDPRLGSAGLLVWPSGDRPQVECLLRVQQQMLCILRTPR